MHLAPYSGPYILSTSTSFSSLGMSYWGYVLGMPFGAKYHAPIYSGRFDLRGAIFLKLTAYGYSVLE